MVRFFARRPQALTLGSALIDVTLVVLKLGLGLLTGSLALVSDAVHSGLDTAASILAFVAVRAAAQPADHEHPYGHGKAENMAAYTEGLLLILAAGLIAYEAVLRLLGHAAAVEAPSFVLALLVVTVAFELGRSTLLRLVARATGSASIEALAADKGADLLSVAAVLAGLVAVRAGLPIGDAVAALLVAVLIVRAAVRLIRQAIDVLMDRAVTSVAQQVLDAAAAVDGVRDARDARVRQSGAQLIGEVEVAGRPTLSLEAAQGLADRVKAAVRDRVPGLELSVYVASGGDPSRFVERVHVTAARNGLFRDLHDVVVEREADDSLHLSLHAKLPPDMSMREATRHARQLEEELRAELAEVGQIDLHLEPLEPDVVHGRDVTDRHPEIVRRLREAAREESRVTSCDEIELSSRAGEIMAHVRVTVPDDLTLVQAHEIETALEERLRQATPDVKQVLVRALG